MNTLVLVLLGVSAAYASLDCSCTITNRGLVKTYDNTHMFIFPETGHKSLVSRWAESNTDPCKFRVRAVTTDSQVTWLAMSVGVHNNAAKFYRNFAFDRFQPNRVEARGKGMKATDISLPYNFNDATYGTDVNVYGSYAAGYVINSTTCDYELRYTPSAASSEAEIKLSISSAKYQTAADKLRGWCQNCNGDKNDDYRMCATLDDVQTAPDAMQQLSDGCAERDNSVITV